MLNPKLKPGDRIRLLYMDGESLTPNTWGTVKSVYNVFGSDDYSVVWDDGDKDNVGERISQLNLISETDAWDFGGREKKSIEEKWSKKYKKSIDCKNPKGFSQRAHCQGRKKITENHDMDTFIRNADVIKYFKMDGKNYFLDLVKFLKILREVSLVNMFQSAPFLYMGREYIDRHYGDQVMNNEEKFQELLDEADNVRNIMIMVTMNLVNDKYDINSSAYDNDDEDDEDENQDKVLQLVNKHIRTLASKVFQIYLQSF